MTARLWYHLDNLAHVARTRHLIPGRLFAAICDRYEARLTRFLGEAEGKPWAA